MRSFDFRASFKIDGVELVLKKKKDNKLNRHVNSLHMLMEQGAPSEMMAG